MQQQHSAKGLDALDDLSAFIRSTVTIHSLITDRIDKLQPSQQLTLKVRPQYCLNRDARTSRWQVTLRCDTVYEGPQDIADIVHIHITLHTVSV